MERKKGGKGEGETKEIEKVQGEELKKRKKSKKRETKK